MPPGAPKWETLGLVPCPREPQSEKPSALSTVKGLHLSTVKVGNPRASLQNQGPRQPLPPGPLRSESLAPVDQIKGPGSPAPRPQTLGPVDRIKGPGRQNLATFFPAPRSRDPKSQKPSRLSTTSKFQVALRCASGSPKVRNPRSCAVPPGAPK